MAQKKFIIDGGFSTNAESTITGNLLMTGSIIPSVDSNGVTGYDLGSATAKWRDLYLSQGSLYIDGQKVLQSDSGTIVVSADVDQSLLTKTTGAGVLTFQSPNPISISGTLQMGTGKRITSADGLAVVFGDKIDMDANQIINVANPTTAQGVATKDYVDVQIGNILNGAPDALNTLNELAAALGDDANFSATITNALALKAATTYVDSQDSATLAAAKAYSDGLAFGQGADLSSTNSRVSTNELEIDALQADMTAAQADILANASDIADNAAAIVAAISTAASDATTKADAAETAANAYTDARETAITSAYTAAIATANAAQDEINELADVNITSVANGQFLRYDLGSTKWVNVTANTTMIAEGTKLFFTDARAQAAVAGDISSAVAVEATARANADAALQTQIDFITSNVDAAALDSLTEIVAAFQTADGNLVTTVTANTTAINNEVTARTNADTTLQANIDTLSDEVSLLDTNLTTAISDISDEATARANADATLQTNINNEASTREASDDTLQSNIDAEATARIAADSAEATARANADAALADDLTSKIGDGTVDGTVGNTLTDRIATALSSANSYTDGRETAITTAYQGYADTAEADAITSANSYTDGRETAITTAYQAADTTLQTQINTEKGRIDAILLAADADKDTFAEIVTFINSVDTTNDTALGTEITTRAAADTALANDLTAKIGDATVDGTSGNTLTDRIATSLSSAQSYADTAEADAITSANSYTDGRETAITTAYQTYADQAEVDAKAYTDTRETAITTAYQTYADSAEADAITSANSYTDGRETAITTAYQTYADTAEADAKAYTDTRETAITTAYQSYADQAEVDAKAYTDTRETAITTAYQTYADSAEADAITSANSYTDGRETAITTAYQTYADQAEVDAKAYTDTRETAITTAYQTYADQAEVDAKAYTDTRETAITTAYQSYADTAEADAITSANSYTDGRETAITTAYQAADTALDNAKVNKTSAQALHATDALRFGANTLSLYKGDGTYETVDLSLYVDDTNLARIVSGTMASNGIATFTRDDATSFTVDMSILLDDTNLSRIVSASWNTGNGVLTLTRNDATTVTVDLDDRYSLTSHNHTLDSLSNVSISGNTDGEILRWNGSDWVNNTLAEAGISATHSHPYLSDTHDMTLTLSGDASGSATFTNMGNATLTVTVADDSHAHVIANVDGLQAALDAKADDATTFTAGAGLTGGGTLGANRTFNVGAGTGITVAADSVSVDTTWSDARYVQPANLENFHSGATSITSAQATANASGTLALTFSELSGAVHYNVYLNRMLLRPTEYSISGTTVTIAQAILATDDEVEVAGLKLV